MVDDILMWTNPKCRPTDITTLLRQALLFRLSRRNHLYTRCFMDKSEQHIMLVVKSHEMLLETYAQKNMINL